jgi:hypothetical protein
MEDANSRDTAPGVAAEPTMLGPTGYRPLINGAVVMSLKRRWPLGDFPAPIKICPGRIGASRTPKTKTCPLWVGPENLVVDPAERDREHVSNPPNTTSIH